MEQRKVLIIIDSLKSGGAEKVLVGILKNLNYNKYSIDLLLINKIGQHIDNIPKEVNVLSLIDTLNREPSIIERVRFRFFFNIPQIIKIILRKKYDVGIAFLEGDSTRILNELDNIRYKIAWVHTDVSKHNIVTRKNIYKNINKIICVSKNSRNKFLEKYEIDKAKVDVIYNAIDIKEVCKLSNEYKVNFDCNINIVSVGRLVEAKGFDLLIKACSELLNSGLDIKLYIVGEGEERKKLERIINELGISNNIYLVGFKKNPYPYIKAADLCISSSRYEGFSLFLAESIILKKKIVATNTQGAIELLEGGKLGLLCECNDINDIKRKLKSAILDNNKKYENYRIIEDRIQSFNKDKIIEEIENLLNKKN